MSLLGKFALHENKYGGGIDHVFVFFLLMENC